MVSNANFFEYAKGVAAGVATKAHIAMYKVCSSLTCKEYYMLAVMDRAASDGYVHIWRN